MKTPDADFQWLSSFNKAASDPLRLQILRVLARDSYSVLELCRIFQLKQPAMSHHLKILSAQALLTKRREGNTFFYSRALAHEKSALQQQLYRLIDQHPLSKEVTSHKQAIEQERICASKRFFCQNLQGFKQQQDLIAQYPTYHKAVIALLDNSPFIEKKHIIEIGPGIGELLPELSQRFEQVTAIDTSATLLNQAKHHCQQHSCQNITFIHNDTKALTNLPQQGDGIVMNMVLHHIPTPAKIFTDLAYALATGGVLLVTELCRHQQDWAKTACGDIWLGFDAEELKHWASSAGFEQGCSNYLALRNGFQIQLQQFIKKRSDYV